MKLESKLVRPLGRYGNSYRLKPITSLFYQVYTCLFYVVIGIFIIKISVDISTGSTNSYKDTNHLIVFLLCALGLAGQLAIASTGKISEAPPTQSNRLTNNNKSNGLFLNIVITIIRYLSCLFLLLLSGIPIFSWLINSVPVHPGTLFLFVVALAILLWMLYRDFGKSVR